MKDSKNMVSLFLVGKFVKNSHLTLPHAVYISHSKGQNFEAVDAFKHKLEAQVFYEKHNISNPDYRIACLSVNSVTGETILN